MVVEALHDAEPLLQQRRGVVRVVIRGRPGEQRETSRLPEGSSERACTAPGWEVMEGGGGWGDGKLLQSKLLHRGAEERQAPA